MIVRQAHHVEAGDLQMHAVTCGHAERKTAPFGFAATLRGDGTSIEHVSFEIAQDDIAALEHRRYFLQDVGAVVGLQPVSGNLGEGGTYHLIPDFMVNDLLISRRSLPNILNCS